MLEENDRNLIAEMISMASKHHKISVKIRIFDDIDDTIAYAKLIEDAGASILTVHGRTIEQKRDKTGLASWKHIKGIVDTKNG